MQKTTTLKTQAIIVTFGFFLALIVGVHISSKQHVDSHGIRVTLMALSDVIKPQYASDVLSRLNAHHPTLFSEFPEEWFTNTNLKYTPLAATKTGDGLIRLTGLSYERMDALGIRLPLFIIQ